MCLPVPQQSSSGGRRLIRALRFELTSQPLSLSIGFLCSSMGFEEFSVETVVASAAQPLPAQQLRFVAPTLTRHRSISCPPAPAQPAREPLTRPQPQEPTGGARIAATTITRGHTPRSQTPPPRRQLPNTTPPRTTREGTAATHMPLITYITRPGTEGAGEHVLFV